MAGLLNPIAYLSFRRSLNPALDLFMLPSSSVLFKTAKLTFTDSYFVLIADMPDLDNVHFESFRQFKSLGAGYLFSII
jgi:hypothetical protein